MRGFALVALFPAVALAHPRPLPLTYLADGEPKGALEIEQYVDLVPTVAEDPNAGVGVRTLTMQLQTEFEYGLTDQLELGLYVTLIPQVGELTNTAVPLEGNGVKERLKYQLAPSGAWPIDVALYGELTENHKEFELEGKIILTRRIGLARLALNLVVEREYYWNGNREWELDPSGGITFEVRRWLHLGAEYWLHYEIPDVAPVRTLGEGAIYSLLPQQYVGPTAMVDLGKLWWSVGVYARASYPRYQNQIGELYGPIWVRTVIGISF